MGGAAAASAEHVSIEQIQTPGNDSTASPYAGEVVTTTGVVTAVNEDGFFVQDGTGAFSGLYVTGETTVSAGDQVELTGQVEESYGLTQLNVSVSDGSVTVSGSAPVPDPVTVSTTNVSSEAYEGVLVRVTNVTVTGAPSSSTYGEWFVDDGTGEARIDDVTVGDVSAPDESGGMISALVGPTYYSFDNFKIQPKSIHNYTASTADQAQPDIDGANLTVLSYNDIQTAASNPTAMGRLVGAVNDRRAAIDHPTLVVGGGDQVSPSSLSPVSNWTVPIQTLNVLNPAAEVIGNHDLDYGFEPVSNFSAASSFPWLVANVQHEDGGNIPGTQNYTIVERGDVTIGIVGLVDEAIKPKTAVDFDDNGYRVTDFVAAGDRISMMLKEDKGVDVVVAATHIGVPESKQLARQTDDIDLIITGDDEVTFPPQTIDGTVVMEAEARAAYLGEANFTVGEEQVAFDGGSLRTLDEESGYTINETARTLVDESRGKYLSTVAGRTAVPLDSTFGSNYAQETRWGNLVADAFLAQTGADVAATNAGGIRGNFVIEPGNITYDDVYTSLPFGNYLVTKEMTGEQLRELLASQVTRLDAQYGGQAQLQVGGVTYEFVDRPGAERKVTDVYVGGQPLDSTATYHVTINSYMAGWSFGDRYGWNMSDLETVGSDYTLYGTAAVEYIESNSPITRPGVDRIRRVTETVALTDVSIADETTELTFEAPANATAVQTGTVRFENATTGEVAASDTRLDDGSVVVTVENQAIHELAASSETIHVYGKYNDSTFDAQRNGFTFSVFNGEVGPDSVMPPAEFTLTSVEAPSEVDPGTTASVTATVSNEGGSTGSATVELSLDASTEATQSVSLAPGESQTVELAIPVDGLSAGEYNYQIVVGNASTSGSMTVSAATTEPPSTEETVQTTTDSASGDGPGFGVPVVLLGVVLFTLVTIRRRE
ncbi:MAG: 5'-nucleotidase C-terminal domain-containing protein [Halapricum sp.]